MNMAEALETLGAQEVLTEENRKYLDDKGECHLFAHAPLVGPADKLNHYGENGDPSAELESIRTRAREGGTQ